MSAPGGRERRPRLSRRPPSRLSLRVEAGDLALTLLEFCAQRGGIPLYDAREVIERGGAYVDGARVHEVNRSLHAGEAIELHLRERGVIPQAAPVLGAERILLLDAHLLAVDKPAGVLAQEGLAGGPDLAALAATLLESRGESGPLLLVHRLDRGTTGVTLLARTRESQSALLAAFRDGKVEKEYLGLCAGAPEQDEFAVDLALGADESRAGRRRPDPQGQPARTRFRVLRRFDGAALIAAFPETGRTHQIRVHLAERGFPLLGDFRYGGPRALTRKDGLRFDFTRPMLHARALRAMHPAGGELRVSAPEPLDLRAALAFLEGAI